VDYLWVIFEYIQGHFYFQLQDVADGVAFIVYCQDFRLITFPVTAIAVYPYLRKEIHADLYPAHAFAAFTATQFAVKREMGFFQASGSGFGCFSIDFPD